MIDDRPALLRAVTANPDDEAPRLVFADWLEEHGEPDAAAALRGKRGAQAVRLAVELPRLLSTVALPLLTVSRFLAAMARPRAAAADSARHLSDDLPGG